MLLACARLNQSKVSTPMEKPDPRILTKMNPTKKSQL